MLLFAGSALILLLAALQYYWPGKWGSSAGIMQWNGAALTLEKGSGHVVNGHLELDVLAEPGVALASLATPAFRAEDYSIVHWAISNTVPGIRMDFLWRTAENPNQIFIRPLEWGKEGILPLQMEANPDWRGHITGLALRVHAPLTVEGVQLVSVAPMRIIWRQWFGAEPWQGYSINFTGENEPRQWILPLPFVVSALVLALLGYGLLVWRKCLAWDARLVWTLVFLAWFVLDLRWQVDLWHKLGATKNLYAGKSWEEKHLAAPDAALFDFMRKVREKLPSNSSRVFLFADDDYIRGRGAYHLYPFNVLSSLDLRSAGLFRPGDYIIFLGKDGVKHDASQQLLKWGAQQLGVELLLQDGNYLLLRVH